MTLNTCLASPSILSVAGKFQLPRQLYCPTIKAIEGIFKLIYFSHLQDKCRPISESVKYRPFEKPKIPPPSLPSQASGNQSSTVEKDVRPKAKPMNISTPRGKNRTTDLPWKSELRTSTASPTEEEAAYDILQRCHLCGILLPLPILKQHQVSSLCSLLIWLGTSWTAS